MMHLKKVQVFLGSGEIAYKLENDELRVWSKSERSYAPGDAQRVKIIRGCKSWSMVDKDENRKFKIGDIVRLKSGGPSMTVKEYQQNFTKTGFDPAIQRVQCTWFDTEEVKLHDAVFNEGQLITDDE